MGIQLIVLTDHHYKWNEEDIELLRKETGVPETFKILSGQEVTTTDFGDILLYGADETFGKQKHTLAEIRERNPDAALIWAHPYRNGKIPHPGQLLSNLIDGVEVFNSNYTLSESGAALKDYYKLKFTGIGGTDTHAYSYTGAYPTVFENQVDSIQDLVREIKGGRCKPYFKEVPRSGTSSTKVTEMTIGKDYSGTNKGLIIKNYHGEAWEMGERSFQILSELIKHGFDKGTYRIPKPLDKDDSGFSLIEERIEGDTLFDEIIGSDPSEGSEYIRMSARWLAKLHNLKLRITPSEEFLRIEPERTEYYTKSLVTTNNKYLDRVREIKEIVFAREKELVTTRPELLVQGHGDFHLKNIYISNKEPVVFVAAIDFDSSYQLPPAFDVGTFLVQYENMFFNEHDIQVRIPSNIFLETYLEAVDGTDDDFMDQVSLFKARCSLSILYYLAKVGLGDSENFFTIMVGAERNLAVIS